MQEKDSHDKTTDAKNKPSDGSGVSMRLQSEQHQNREESHSQSNEKYPEDQADRFIAAVRTWLAIKVKDASLIDVVGIVTGVCLIGVGVWAGIIYNGQLKEMVTSNNDARDVSEKQLRPSVDLANSKVEILQGNNLNIWLEFKNYGVTLANHVTYERITYIAPMNRIPRKVFRRKFWPETSAEPFNLAGGQSVCINWRNVTPNQWRELPDEVGGDISAHREHWKESITPILYVGADLQYTDITDTQCYFDAFGVNTLKPIRPGTTPELGVAFSWDNQHQECIKDTTPPRGPIPKDQLAAIDGVPKTNPSEVIVKFGECPK